MTRPVNGKPAWLIERLKERPRDGVPEFVDTYLRMKYGANDIARIKAGYECKRTPALWVNPAVYTVGEAQAALAEAGIASEPHAWCSGVLAVTQEELARFSECDLAAQGNIRVLDDPTALLAAEVTAQAANELASAREAAAAEAERAAAAEASQANGEAQSGAEGAPQEAGSDTAPGERTPQAAQAAQTASAKVAEPAETAASEPNTDGADASASSAASGAANANEQQASAPAVPDDVPANEDSAANGTAKEDNPALVSVAELCAGTGTMTLPLAAAVHNGVRIHACEISSTECDQLSAALEAVGATNVDAQRYDSRRFRSDEHAFDIILLDPPCTPTGTLYAHDPHLHAQFPEAKIPEYMALAKSLFLLSLSMLNVGGTLIYTTTSVLHLENEEVLRTCLARSGSMGTFEIEPIELPVTANLPQLPTTADGTILTCPSEACPGRFIAKIRRTA